MLALGDSGLRKEADAMTFVGCDLHTRMQQVAVLDTRTGEVSERQLAHDGSAIEEFYAALPGPVTIGIESTGYATWFHTLIQRLGHTLLVGDAAKIRAMVVRKTKTDRRDALHLLDLLRHDRFPTVWVPDPATPALPALLPHRLPLAPTPPLSNNALPATHLTKQGSPLLRLALGQAAAHAARMDTDLKRTSFTLVHRRGRPKAKVAVARKLLVRLFIMLRDQIDYDEFRRRGRTAPASA